MMKGFNAMNVIAFNGSPRKKNWNTVTLLENALKGAEAEGAQTELVNLYDFKFSGCISCFACKKLNRKKDGVCAVNDDLTPILDRVRHADALIVGTPVYYGAESAATRALLERLLFPYNNYSKEMKSLFPRTINTGLIYTMNVTVEDGAAYGYNYHFNMTRTMLSRHFGPCEMLVSGDTLQYGDYSKYESERFDDEAKVKRHDEIFPSECKEAFELGRKLVASS